MTMQYKYHSLQNNQEYNCSEHDKDGNLVSDDPIPVRYGNMFLFDISPGNFLQIRASRRDSSVDKGAVYMNSLHVDKDCEPSYQCIKSKHVAENVVRIYKTDVCNAVVFSTFGGLACIFAVPQADFTLQHLIDGKRPVVGYPIVSEDHKEAYHQEKMREIHKQFEEYFEKGKIPADVMEIIRELIVPNYNRWPPPQNPKALQRHAIVLLNAYAMKMCV